jgi:hypothetical protein
MSRDIPKMIGVARDEALRKRINSLLAQYMAMGSGGMAAAAVAKLPNPVAAK